MQLFGDRCSCHQILWLQVVLFFFDSTIIKCCCFVTTIIWWQFLVIKYTCNFKCFFGAGGFVQNFNHTTLRKRHKAWGNSDAISLLNRGVLRAADRQGCFVKTTNRKRKGNKWVYSGNKNLKKTQSYPVPFGLKVLRILPRLISSPVGGPVPPAVCDGPKVFAEKQWDDLWCEANVLESCIYMRGSLHLAASARWKDVFPLGLPLEWWKKGLKQQNPEDVQES